MSDVARDVAFVVAAVARATTLAKAPRRITAATSAAVACALGQLLLLGRSPTDSRMAPRDCAPSARDNAHAGETSTELRASRVSTRAGKSAARRLRQKRNRAKGAEQGALEDGETLANTAEVLGEVLDVEMISMTPALDSLLQTGGMGRLSAVAASSSGDTVATIDGVALQTLTTQVLEPVLPSSSVAVMDEARYFLGEDDWEIDDDVLVTAGKHAGRRGEVVAVSRLGAKVRLAGGRKALFFGFEVLVPTPSVQSADFRVG